MAEKFMKSTAAGELVWDSAPIADIPCDTPVRKVLSVMAEKNVVALPVRKGSKYVGMVSCVDLLMHITFGKVGNALADAKEISDEDVKKCMEMKVEDVMGIVEEDKVFWVFEASDSLDKVAEALMKGVHRVMVGAGVDTEDRKVYRFLTQTDVIRHFALYVEELGDFPKGSVKDVMSTKLVTVTKNDTALDAFRKMQVHEVSAVPIVDNEGEIITQLSASDVRGLYDIKHLKQSCLAYRQWRTSARTARPVTLRQDSTLEQAMAKAAIAKVHRLWVVDDKNRPVGCVSLTDIIAAACRT